MSVKISTIFMMQRDSVDLSCCQLPEFCINLMADLLVLMLHIRGMEIMISRNGEAQMKILIY